jgi:transposase
MISKQTIEAVAKLYFKQNVCVWRIARMSENLTIGNVIYCIKEMQHMYYPIIVNTIYESNRSEYSERNKNIANLYQSGYSFTKIAKIFNLSKARIGDIIHKLMRLRRIHPIRNFSIIHEPNLYIDNMKDLVMKELKNGTSINKISKNEDIPYEKIKEWVYEKEQYEKEWNEKRKQEQEKIRKAEEEYNQFFERCKMHAKTAYHQYGYSIIEISIRMNVSMDLVLKWLELDKRD